MSIAYKVGKRQASKDTAAEKRLILSEGRAKYGPRYLDTIFQSGMGFHCAIDTASHYRGYLTLAEFAKSVFGTGSLRKVAPCVYVVLAAPKPIQVLPKPGRASSWMSYDDGGPGIDSSLPHFGHPA